MDQITADRVEFPRIDGAGRLTKSEYQFAFEQTAASRNWAVDDVAHASSILKELYINSVEYTGKAPTVSLQRECRDDQNRLTLSVADQGIGILGHFLGSLPGQHYSGKNPPELLRELLLTKLSSKSSRSAGDGFLNVLRAAEEMRACVSLETGSLCWEANFADDCFELPAVMHLSNPYKGTRWKISWPMNSHRR